MSLLTIEEPADGTDSMQEFNASNYLPKLYELFKQAVLSNNYPVIGLFMIGGGAIMKLFNADIPVWTYRVMSVSQAEQAPYGGGWLWLSHALGLTGSPAAPAGSQRTLLGLSDILVSAGLVLLGAPLIGKAQSFIP